MLVSPSSLATWATEERLWKWGQVFLVIGLILAIILTLGLAATRPAILPFVPLLLIGAVILSQLWKHPLLHLGIILAMSVLLFRKQEGLQILEILVGIYIYGYLTCWFFLRRFFYEQQVLRTLEAWALFLFLAGTSFSVILTLFFGGDLRMFLSEWTAMGLLAMYFPVREGCRRYEKGVVVTSAAVLWIGLFAAGRNLFNYQSYLEQAVTAMSVMGGREQENDILMMMAFFVATSLLIYTRRLSYKVVLASISSLCIIGLIITQSRAYWVTVLVGFTILFLLLEPRAKRRLFTLSWVGIAAFIAIGVVFFGEYIDLISAGIVRRFLTLETAASNDISLINRFYETNIVWKQIVQNPILGHGMAVPYDFYDIILQASWKKTFIHNGYISLLYRFGIWGFGLVLFFWIYAIWQGFNTYRRRFAPDLLRAVGVAVGTALTALMLVANTSNPFFSNEATFIIGVMAGLAAGAHERASLIVKDRLDSSIS